MDENKKNRRCWAGLCRASLAVSLARSYSVVGFDIDTVRIKELENGTDRTQEVAREELIDSTLICSADKSSIEGADVYIVTVPTPVAANSQPDLSAIKNASKLVGENLSIGALVVYESTVYPGVTEEICGYIRAGISP